MVVKHNAWTRKNQDEGYFKKEIAWYNAHTNFPQTLPDIRSRSLHHLTEKPDNLSNKQIDYIIREQIIDKLNDNLKHKKIQRTHPEMEGHFEPYLKKYIDLADLKITTVPLLKIKAFQGLRDPPAFYKGDLNQKERERVARSHRQQYHSKGKKNYEQQQHQR